MDQIIYGRNPVIEAIKAGRTINRILIVENLRSMQNLYKLAKENNIPIQSISKSQMDSKYPGNHQGVVALAAEAVYYEVEDILQAAADKDEQPFILLLEEIEDPHNLGAIIRTAYAAGVHGIIIPKRRAAAVNETVAKTSAGAVEYVKIARVANVGQTINMLKDKGCWIAGADAEGKVDMWNADLLGPLALVIGNEGKGLKRLTKEMCDFLIGIPMKGQVASLNASVAAAVLCYEAVRQRTQRQVGDV